MHCLKKGLGSIPKIKAISFKGLTDRGLAGVADYIIFYSVSRMSQKDQRIIKANRTAC